MAAVTQLGYLGLSVSNVDEWERFAESILGLQSNGRDGDGSLFLRMDEYHHRFALHPTGKDDLAYIGWEVATEEALQEMAAQLTAAGVAVQHGTREEADARRVAGLIKFTDPSGIPSEIFYGPLVLFDRPFHSPRPISGFKTGEQGLGHFVIWVDDFARSLHFYRDVLGMRISDFVRFAPAPQVQLNVVFFHCNPRHHSLAFATLPQASPKRLHHFMLQVQSLDDVGSTYYLCQDRNVPIVMSLGKHTNDHMVSFYLRTPSGFAVEYGWGAREVDDRTWQVQVHTAGSMWGHRGSL
ncbi:MAG: biphenyl-2,3-diol 1,2-dioxygenase [Candidatus Binatia bacterium]|nr:biphenyl-2,3-diol 1,2-dioxygenase [Candidatus Binatia bacterium]